MEFMNLSDEQVIESWTAWTTGKITLGKTEVDDLIGEMRWRHAIKISIDGLPKSIRKQVTEHFQEKIADGVIFDQQTGQRIYDAAQSAVLKARNFFAMRGFNTLIGGDVAFGFVRFEEPELVPWKDAVKRSDEHQLTEDEMKKFWKSADALYLYKVRDFIPLDKPYQIEPIEGQNLIVSFVKSADQSKAEKVDTTDSEWSTGLEIIKMDEDQRLVTGIVLEPTTPENTDLQGDWYTEEDIQETMLDFAEHSGMVDVDHDLKVRKNISLVENWQERVDIEISGTKILKGTWLSTLRVRDDETWKRIKAGWTSL